LVARGLIMHPLSEAGRKVGGYDVDAHPEGALPALAAALGLRPPEPPLVVARVRVGPRP
jgi:hypothetical protein